MTHILGLMVRVITEQSKNMFFDDSSDEEREVIIEKVDNFAEHTVPNMTDRQFEQHFRMKPDTFEDLLRKLHTVMLESDTKSNGFPRTKLEKELMITVWYLGNLESFRTVANRFGIAKSTCWDILIRICKLLLNVNNRYKVICWPSAMRQDEISQHFARNGFPGIIGCIDGTHIQIVAPKRFHVSYINRKGFHSVLLQAVCDHRKLFTDVYAGEAGSIHDYTLYKRSPLYRNIQNRIVTFHNDTHIIGDLAYKLETHMVVGFKNNRRLTVRQKNFNYILSNSRVRIENTFALLKGRFRKLKYMETVRLDLVALLIVSSCILHNICLLNGDVLDGILNIGDELQEILNNNPHNLLDIDREIEQQAAINKRNNIMNALPIRIPRE